MIQDITKADAQTREHPDPHEGSVPVPRMVIIAVSCLVLWAVGYIVTMHPSDSPVLGDSRTKADLMARPGGATGVVDGAQIFAAQCVACHQATGLGLPGVFPPLAGSEWVLAKDTLPVNILLHGITGKLTVKGTAYNGQMPAFGEKLGDAEIAAVLTYIRSSFGNSAGKIDASVVKAQRDATKDRKAPWNGDNDLAKLK